MKKTVSHITNDKYEKIRKRVITTARQHKDTFDPAIITNKPQIRHLPVSSAVWTPSSYLTLRSHSFYQKKKGKKRKRKEKKTPSHDWFDRKPLRHPKSPEWSGDKWGRLEQ